MRHWLWILTPPLIALGLWLLLTRPPALRAEGGPPPADRERDPPPPAAFSLVDTGQSLGDAPAFSLALGDLDGDGDVDLVVGNGYGRRAWIWRANGDGTFEDGGPVPGDYFEAHGVALGDVDGDGDLDLALADFNQRPNRILQNDGSGRFEDSGQRLGAGDSKALALGDVDGDGDLDLVVANWGHPGSGRRSPNTVWLNDGKGTFTDSGQRLGRENSEDLALGDLDQDGDLDLVVANFTGQPNEVWLNDGNGRFEDSGQRLGTGDTTCLGLGDLDGDGDLDLVTGNLGFGAGAPDRAWKNDGRGRFEDTGQALGHGDTVALALADLDADGDLDLVAGDNARVNAVFLNDGHGTFGADPAGFLATPARSTTAWGAIDLDGDGRVDVLVEACTSNVREGHGVPDRVWRVERPARR